MIALRKFTLSELLDTGFNISMVLSGSGTVRRYWRSTTRRADGRKAAEHLGRMIHGGIGNS